VKRVQAACLLQTLHFQLKEDVAHDLAVKTVQDEVAHYKAQLERNRTAYKIDEETIQPDGSILIKIRKQYNAVRVGDYLD
jgi:hypothetical protein